MAWGFFLTYFPDGTVTSYVRRSDVESVEHSHIRVYGFLYLTKTYILVGGVRSCRVTRSDLQRVEGHESLVAERRRTERFFSQHDEPVKMEPKVAQDILPGGNKAIILLADGEKVDVEWLADSSRYKVDGIEVTTGEGKIRYKGKNNTKVEYNTIMIPRGGEYQVELSDGTKVWLNAETQLRIPTAFVGTERRVFLKGEAYFDVTKNDKQPFIVETDLGEVKVYGTQFNVKFYPEEKEIKATLVEGNIGFKSEEVAELKIKPGYQLRLAEGAKKPEVKPVKIYNEIAWKNRMFCFESERLESIMLKLERWYNVDIIFEDSGLKKFKFSGNLNRYDNIDKILHFFEEVFDVKFAVEENTIKVMRK